MKLYMIPQNTYLTLKYGVYFRRYYRQRKKISIWLCIELWMWAYIPGTCCNQKFSLFTKRIYILFSEIYFFYFVPFSHKARARINEERIQINTTVVWATFVKINEPVAFFLLYLMFLRVLCYIWLCGEFVQQTE